MTFGAAIIARLHTTGGETWLLIEHADGKSITIHTRLFIQKYSTLAKALQTLACMLHWDFWTTEAQERLRNLNNGQGF